jgi:tetratricopeptide (TPR) repeat protein
VEKQKFDEAKKEFNKAVQEYPAFAQAWAELSDLELKAQDFDNARSAAEKAIEADPKFVRPYFTMIVLSAGKQEWKAVTDYSDRLLALDSLNYPAGFYYSALANYKLHNLEKAETSIRAARKLDINSKLPKIGLLQAAIMMDRDDYAGAVQEYQTFLERVPEGSDAQYARSALTVAQNKLASARK